MILLLFIEADNCVLMIESHIRASVYGDAHKSSFDLGAKILRTLQLLLGESELTANLAAVVFAEKK
ncbi:MAG: hypothetical protein AAF483_04470 [Planctomycetota bacterium]